MESKKYGSGKRRTWRKLHLAVDEATNEIHAVELTTNAISDADMVKPLVANITCPIARLSSDGAYDQVKVYDDRTYFYGSNNRRGIKFVIFFTSLDNGINPVDQLVAHGVQN